MERLLKQIISRDALRAFFVNSINISKFLIREIIEKTFSRVGHWKTKIVEVYLPYHDIQ